METFQPSRLVLLIALAFLGILCGAALGAQLSGVFHSPMVLLGGVLGALVGGCLGAAYNGIRHPAQR
jgi:hypothetical protein